MPGHARPSRGAAGQGQAVFTQGSQLLGLLLPTESENRDTMDSGSKGLSRAALGFPRDSHSQLLPTAWTSRTLPVVLGQFPPLGAEEVPLSCQSPKMLPIRPQYHPISPSTLA